MGGFRCIYTNLLLPFFILPLWVWFHRGEFSSVKHPNVWQMVTAMQWVTFQWQSCFYFLQSCFNVFMVWAPCLLSGFGYKHEIYTGCPKKKFEIDFFWFGNSGHFLAILRAFGRPGHIWAFLATFGHSWHCWTLLARKSPELPNLKKIYLELFSDTLFIGTACVF